MKLPDFVFPFSVGLINSLFGAGGGMLSVPYMKKQGLDQKKSQATTLSVILPLSIVSALLYLFNGAFSLSSAIKYIPFGLAGAIAGVKITEKAQNKILKILFGLFMIWSGLRMIW